MNNIVQEYTKALDELTAIAAQLKEEELETLARKIIEAKHVFFTAQGRSGNMARALAIRFMHMGIVAYVAGEPSTPAMGQGDLLIAVSGSGKTTITLNHLQTAKKVGAASALICTKTENPMFSDCYVCIPAKSVVPSVQHAGSLFEQSVLLVGDAVSRAVQDALGVSSESMDARHANLQ